MPTHVGFTSQVLGAAEALRRRQGPLKFHLSGGCREGAVPIRFEDRDSQVRPVDVRLHEVVGTPTDGGSAQFADFADTTRTIDVAEEGGAGFRIVVAPRRRFTALTRPLDTTSGRGSGSAADASTGEGVSFGISDDGCYASRLGHGADDAS